MIDQSSPKPVRAKSRKKAWWSLLGGLVLVSFALGFMDWTLWTGSYVPLLFSQFILAVLALICFFIAFQNGGIIVKILSVFFLLPTYVLLADFVKSDPLRLTKIPDYPVPQTKFFSITSKPAFRNFDERASTSRYLVLNDGAQSVDIYWSNISQQEEFLFNPVSLDPAETYDFTIEQTFRESNTSFRSIPTRNGQSCKLPRQFHF